VEFLVNITLNWPRDMDADQKQQISEAEWKKAAELAGEGKLVRMWRVPCRFENWGLWRADDATDLHETISSLPAFPYMTKVDVHPLAKHKVDPLQD